ncbi:hypothetical protein HPB50_011180 [Hyalomma asiaticum]|uniref:Uncharacterized protein n=1 Tax=Hyalomma asiaticum TaxID=266040 RepID=A0ACB7RM90_HYAAI|nr:hypothetical protein HPB50_011180 [Hyalomma asiaticum]
MMVTRMPFFFMQIALIWITASMPLCFRDSGCDLVSRRDDWRQPAGSVNASNAVPYPLSSTPDLFHVWHPSATLCAAASEGLQILPTRYKQLGHATAPMMVTRMPFFFMQVRLYHLNLKTWLALMEKGKTFGQQSSCGNKNFVQLQKRIPAKRPPQWNFVYMDEQVHVPEHTSNALSMGSKSVAETKWSSHELLSLTRQVSKAAPEEEVP